MSREGRIVNVQSTGYYLAQARVRCGHCSRETKVVALGVPSGHRVLELAESRHESDARRPMDVWQRSDLNAFLFYVRNLNAAARDYILRTAPFYRFAHSTVTFGTYWANHCERCGSMLEDHEIHCEPDVAFVPANEARARGVHISRIGGRLEAGADGYALEPQFFDSMIMS